MIDAEKIWVDEFKKLGPAKTVLEGLTNMAIVIEKLTNKVEPVVSGAVVSPGIFKWNRNLFVSQLLNLSPTATTDWIPKVTKAWAAACTQGVIAPSKVSFPATWTQSTTDTLTSPSPAGTITTIQAGKNAIEGALNAIPGLMTMDFKKAQEEYAKAFRLGPLAFNFNLVGIGGSSSSPVTIPVTAKAK